MKQQSQVRSQVVHHYVRRMLQETSTSIETLATRVRDYMAESISLADMPVLFQSGGDLHANARVNGQKLARILDNPRKQESQNVEEAIVKCLPEPYHTQCVRELAARYGLNDVPLPMACGIADAVTDLQRMSRMTREFGAAFERMAPIIADGEVGANDACHIPAALKDLAGVISAVEGLMARLRAVQAVACEGSKS